jgi:Fe-S-cluster containining protein
MNDNLTATDIAPNGDAMPELEFLVRESPFSYQCNQCSRCCRHYSIKVNPYEVARLARNRDMTTTAFIHDFTTDQGTVLKREPRGACVFLGERGCTVHVDRPLVCRLYPLGRDDSQANGERFHRIDAVPGSLGTFADTETLANDNASPTVHDYLVSQGAELFIDAVDAYSRLLALMLAKLREMDTELIVNNDATPAMLMDIDAFLAAEGATATASTEVKMRAHVEGIEAWLARELDGRR